MIEIPKRGSWLPIGVLELPNRGLELPKEVLELPKGVLGLYDEGAESGVSMSNRCMPGVRG